jgi:hypothetical protein
MNPPQRVLLLLLIFAAAPTILNAKEWRGIVPLHSTRADVARLFNECLDARGGCSFTRGNEEVSIVLSGESGFTECPEKLPSETVLLVEVKLIKPIKFSNLRIDKKALKRFDPAYPKNIGYLGYLDEIGGLVIQTYKGDVLQFDYIAAKRDVKLCPGYYDSPQSFVQILIEGCCPSLTLTCPQSKPTAGEQIKFSASEVDDNVELGWSVTKGKIISGQGTREITVDTSGLDGQVITATVDMYLKGKQHSYSFSCSVEVLPKP